MERQDEGGTFRRFKGKDCLLDLGDVELAEMP
jgi:hypothetical protein